MAPRAAQAGAEHVDLILFFPKRCCRFLSLPLVAAAAFLKVPYVSLPNVNPFPIQFFLGLLFWGGGGREQGMGRDKDRERES